MLSGQSIGFSGAHQVELLVFRHVPRLIFGGPCHTAEMGGTAISRADGSIFGIVALGDLYINRPKKNQHETCSAGVRGGTTPSHPSRYLRLSSLLVASVSNCSSFMSDRVLFGEMQMTSSCILRVLIVG